MSQHFFQTKHKDTEVIVQLGYDRPLGHVFMVVQAASGQQDPIYSNLFQVDPFGLTLDDYRRVLADLQITVPDAMFRQVEIDEMYDVGNRVVWYEADGSYEER